MESSLNTLSLCTNTPPNIHASGSPKSSKKSWAEAVWQQGVWKHTKISAACETKGIVLSEDVTRLASEMDNALINQTRGQVQVSNLFGMNSNKASPNNRHVAHLWPASPGLAPVRDRLRQAWLSILVVQTIHTAWTGSATACFKVIWLGLALVQGKESEPPGMRSRVSFSFRTAVFAGLPQLSCMQQPFPPVTRGLATSLSLVTLWWSSSCRGLGDTGGQWHVSPHLSGTCRALGLGAGSDDSLECFFLWAFSFVTALLLTLTSAYRMCEFTACQWTPAACYFGGTTVGLLSDRILLSFLRTYGAPLGR